MLHANKTASTRSTLAAVAVGVILSFVVLNGERHHAAVFVDDSISATVATSAAAPSAAFDYLPSRFAAPAGAAEELPPQF